MGGHLKMQSCRVDKVANRVTFDRQLQALRQVMIDRGTGIAQGVSGNADRRIDPNIRAIILAELTDQIHSGGEPTTFSEPVICARPPQKKTFFRPSEYTKKLNTSQQNAIKSATSRVVTLIQGPPGTGKTHTSIGVAEQWVRSGIRPIVACADSNMGVDNLYHGMQRAGLKAVRVGGKFDDDKLANCNFSFLSQAAGMDKGLGKGKLEGKEKDAMFAQLKRELKVCEVICCTCAGSGSDTLKDLLP